MEQNVIQRASCCCCFPAARVHGVRRSFGNKQEGKLVELQQAWGNCFASDFTLLSLCHVCLLQWGFIIVIWLMAKSLSEPSSIAPLCQCCRSDFPLPLGLEDCWNHLSLEGGNNLTGPPPRLQDSHNAPRGPGCLFSLVWVMKEWDAKNQPSLSCHNQLPYCKRSPYTSTIAVVNIVL